jgi:hypothetical protein
MGYDSSGGGVIYTCPHTGETFMGRDLATAKAQALSCSPNCEGALSSGNRSVLTGQPSDQVGSQYWMNANTAGKIIDEPSLEVKAKLSDANYAAGWLGVYARTIPASVAVSNATADIQKYPVSVGTAEIWAAVPQLSPKPDVNYNTPSNSPGSDAEPDHISMATQGETVGTSEAKSPVETAKSALSALPVGLIVILALIVGLVFMVGRGLAGGARA